MTADPRAVVLVLVCAVAIGGWGATAWALTGGHWWAWILYLPTAAAIAVLGETIGQARR